MFDSSLKQTIHLTVANQTQADGKCRKCKMLTDASRPYATSNSGMESKAAGAQAAAVALPDLMAFILEKH